MKESKLRSLPRSRRNNCPRVACGGKCDEAAQTPNEANEGAGILILGGGCDECKA